MCGISVSVVGKLRSLQLGLRKVAILVSESHLQLAERGVPMDVILNADVVLEMHI